MDEDEERTELIETLPKYTKIFFFFKFCFKISMVCLYLLNINKIRKFFQRITYFFYAHTRFAYLPFI